MKPVTRLFDPYNSLGATGRRVGDVALLYVLVTIALTWLFARGELGWMLIPWALIAAIAIWEALLLAKLKDNLNALPLKNSSPVATLLAKSGWVFNVICAFLAFQLMESANRRHSQSTNNFFGHVAREMPWVIALVVTIFFVGAAVVFVHKWRRVSKIVFERPPADPVLEKMARELDDWLTSPKRAIQ